MSIVLDHFLASGRNKLIPTENGAYVAFTYKEKQCAVSLDEWKNTWSKQVDTYDGVLLKATASDNTEHMFIVAPTQASGTLILWHSSSIAGGTEYITDSSKAKLDFDGYNKTQTIIKTLSQESTTSYAPGYCYNYSYGNIPAHSWYLPALGEVDLIWQNKSAINTVLTGLGQSSLTEDRYWSSTEYSSDYAWREYMTDGHPTNGPKSEDSYYFYARACTAFNS